MSVILPSSSRGLDTQGGLTDPHPTGPAATGLGAHNRGGLFVPIYHIFKWLAAESGYIYRVYVIIDYNINI